MLVLMLVLLGFTLTAARLRRVQHTAARLRRVQVRSDVQHTAVRGWRAGAAQRQRQCAHWRERRGHSYFFDYISTHYELDFDTVHYVCGFL